MSSRKRRQIGANISDHRLSFLVHREWDIEGHEGWIAECLEYEIVVQGKTLSMLQDRIQSVLVGQAVLDLESGREPFSEIKRESGEEEQNKILTMTEMFAQAFPVELELPTVLDSLGSHVPEPEHERPPFLSTVPETRVYA